MELFLKQGRCINCHSGPEFTSATVQQVRPEPIEFMAPEHGPAGFYDAGFYNIGVRPEAEDPGLKAGVTIAGVFKPFSRARRLQLGQPVDVTGVTIGTGDRVIDSGSFKTPTLRNIELTGPYFHNGGAATLEEVVEFYARGTDFFDNPDLDPDVGGIGKVRGNSQRIAAMVAFMKTLTDERVRYRRAPFDHPELILPNGHLQAVPIPGMPATDNNVTIPAVGMSGGTPLKSFIQTLTDGGFR